MDKSEVVFTKIKQILVQEFNVNPERITMDSTVGDNLGFDSLETLELFNQIESEFLIDIKEEFALNLKNINGLVNYVIKKIDDEYFE